MWACKIWAVALLFTRSWREIGDKTAMLIDVDMDVDSVWSVPESGIKRRASRRSDTAPRFTHSLWLNHSQPASEARRRSLALSSSPLFDIVLGQWIRKGNESLSTSLRKLSSLNYFSLLWWAWKMLFWSQCNLSWINPSQLIPHLHVYHASKPSITNLYLVSACETDSWSSVELTQNVKFEAKHVKDFVNKVSMLNWVWLVFM